MGWETIDRPGYFGKSRNEIEQKFDLTYGPENWRIAWQWGSGVIDKPVALQIYEDGYYEFLKKKPELIHWLVSNYEDVYDDNVSNVHSGLDYRIQETNATHLQDIAVRRSLLRHGHWFNGSGLLQVRGNDKQGRVFSPFKIPFHLPHMIYPGKVNEPTEELLKKYGVPESIEMFYQRNKLLQVKSE